jgi:hypothetical protein
LWSEIARGGISLLNWAKSWFDAPEQEENDSALQRSSSKSKPVVKSSGAQTSSSSPATPPEGDDGDKDRKKERKENTPQMQKDFIDKKVDSKTWIEGHKIGGRKCWRDKETGLYYTKDSRHNDMEVWKVTGKRAEHQGSLEVEIGRMYKGPNHDPQSFE